MDWLINFLANPLALDPTLVPFVTKLIAGNVITASVVWGILKYCAVKSTWAVDDKVIQFLTGMFKAAKDSIPQKGNQEPTEPIQEPVIEYCDHCGALLESHDDSPAKE